MGVSVGRCENEQASVARRSKRGETKQRTPKRSVESIGKYWQVTESLYRKLVDRLRKKRKRTGDEVSIK